MTIEYVVGVDLGGTKVEACLLDSARNVLQRHRAPVEAAVGFDHVIRNILDVIEKTAGETPFTAVGIGTPGTYVPDEDRLYGSPHTPVYETPGLIGSLRDSLSVPVLVENDADCLALAEYFASCAGKYHYVMAVIMGTGFGSGLILGDRLYRGALGGAGELGHVVIDMDGRRCECGLSGCVEAYLSGPSHSRRFAELSGKKLSVPEIYSLYQSDDAQAVELFEASCRILAQVFANAVTLLDLDAIILGGGVSNLPIWYQKVPAMIMERYFGVRRKQIPLIKAKLGDSAGVFGAAYLALRERKFMDF